MLNVIYAECHHAKCRYPEYHGATKAAYLATVVIYSCNFYYISPGALGY
jgi:hypothetical protein